MAYPAGTIRPEQIAATATSQQQPGHTVSTAPNQQHLTQLQPGQQIVLQPATVSSQPQQVQLAQLMQNQTIQVYNFSLSFKVVLF